MGEVSPRIIVTLEPELEKNVLTSIQMQVSMPRMLQGNLHQYILDMNGFGRGAEKQVESLRAFRSVASREGGYSCMIGRKKFAEFYYRVLPMLRDAEEITLVDHVGSLIESALPPEAEFTFYLDLHGRILSCRTTAGYEGKTVTLGFEAQDPSIASRDRDQENRVMGIVRSFFPGVSPEQEAMTVHADGENLMRVMSEGVNALSAFGEVRGSDAFHRVRVIPAPSPKITVRMDSGLLDLSIETKDIPSGELLELLASYRMKKRWYRLKNGDYVDLQNATALDELQETAQAMDVSMEELVSHGVRLPKYRSLYIDRLLEDHEELAASRDRTFKALIRSFQTIRDSDFEVPGNLISLKAGGTGLNLTGADVVIHYDPWWNLAVQNQATDRAHRIGQTRQVTVVKLIAAGTIEEKILDLQEAKRELAEMIISGESTSLMSLSREELLALLD